MTNLDSILKSGDISLLTKVQSDGFSSSHVWCESLTIKKAEYLKTDVFNVVLKKTFESPLDSKEIKPVNPKEIQP